MWLYMHLLSLKPIELPFYWLYITKLFMSACIWWCMVLFSIWEVIYKNNRVKIGHKTIKLLVESRWANLPIRTNFHLQWPLACVLEESVVSKSGGFHRWYMLSASGGGGVGHNIASLLEIKVLRLVIHPNHSL